jgi:hypothetical protein
LQLSRMSVLLHGWHPKNNDTFTTNCYRFIIQRA